MKREAKLIHDINILFLALERKMYGPYTQKDAAFFVAFPSFRNAFQELQMFYQSMLNADVPAYSYREKRKKQKSYRDAFEFLAISIQRAYDGFLRPVPDWTVNTQRIPLDEFAQRLLDYYPQCADDVQKVVSYFTGKEIGEYQKLFEEMQTVQVDSLGREVMKHLANIRYSLLASARMLGFSDKDLKAMCEK